METIEIFKSVFGNEPFFSGRTAGVQTPRLEENLVLTALVSSVVSSGRPVRVLEVGSWLGFSALTRAHAIDALSLAGGSVTCVDIWAPFLKNAELSDSETVYSAMDGLARNGLAFDLFRHNISCGPPRVPIGFERGNSAEILRTFEARSFDLVYIDGSHYYEAVRDDLAAAIGLVSSGGVLCGDDLEVQVGEIPKDKVVANLSGDCVRDEQLGWYFPGVTLAVHEALGPVEKHGRTWFMRKTEGGFVPVDLSSQRMMVPPHWPPVWHHEAAKLLRPTVAAG